MTESSFNARRIFSLRRVMLVAVPAILVTAVSLWYLKTQEAEAVRKGDEWATQRFGLDHPTTNRLSADYQDGDGDLLADRPDPANCSSPETLYFSYIPGNDPEHLSETWQELTDAISESTGRPVEFKQLNTLDDQLNALADGELHITGVNTGAVPMAVNASGFVPLFVIGNADGSFGYTMQFIVPTGSDIRSIEHLRSKRITFTTTNSNSGFKAPVVMLMYDHQMRPGRDYDYGFSTSHDDSIRGIANQSLTVAAVASDMLDRCIARGDVEADAIEAIYTSERFPTATLGCAYNLDGELVEQISEAISNFRIDGTAMQTAIGLPEGAKFVPVNYKDAWALIRRTDDALGVIHALHPTEQNVSEGSSRQTESELGQ